MNQFLLRGFFVLISGLTACSPQSENVPDVYSAPPPVLKGARGRQELQSWDAERNRRLDIQDSWDFTKASPHDVTISSQCRSGSENFTQTQTFSDSTVHIWQTLPKHILLQDLTAVTCAFELNLFNENGSNHVFIVSAVPIYDEEPPAVTLSHLRITPADVKDVRVRNEHQGRAELLCQDGDLGSLPFAQAMDFSLFNLGAAHGHSVQKCRVAIDEGSKRVALSALFSLVLPLPSLEINVTQAYYRTREFTPATRAAAGTLFAGLPLTIGEFTIKNSTQIRRYLRLPLKGFHLSVSVFFATQFFHIFEKRTAIMENLFLHALTPLPAGSDKNSQTVMLGAGESLRLELRYVPPPQLCRTSDFQLEDFESIPVEEVNELGDLMAIYPLAADGKVYLLDAALSAQQFKLKPYYCP